MQIECICSSKMLDVYEVDSKDNSKTYSKTVNFIAFINNNNNNNNLLFLLFLAHIFIKMCCI